MCLREWLDNEDVTKLVWDKRGDAQSMQNTMGYWLNSSVVDLQELAMDRNINKGQRCGLNLFMQNVLRYESR